MTTQNENPFYELGWHLNKDLQCYQMFVLDKPIESISVEEINAINLSTSSLYELMREKRNHAEAQLKKLLYKPLLNVPAVSDQFTKWLYEEEHRGLEMSHFSELGERLAIKLKYLLERLEIK